MTGIFTTTFRHVLFIVCVMLFSAIAIQANAQETHEAHDSHEAHSTHASHDDHLPDPDKKGFQAGDLILHHIADSHEWHFATVGHTHLTIPLPVILFAPGHGFDTFFSSKFHNETHTYKGYVMDEHEHIHRADGGTFYDLSITRNVASMLISALLLLAIFLPIAGSYKKHGSLKAPKGLQSALEPIIIFVRDEIALGGIGPNYKNFLPYLLTLFFYIWINNMLGLLPGGANMTGNIAITLTLAVITFLVVNFSGNKHYWAHVFNTPGVPWWLKYGIPLMPIIEFIGLFTKPFSLMVVYLPTSPPDTLLY